MPLFQNYFIPTSLIAGIIGLILNRDLIQQFLSLFINHSVLEESLFSNEIKEVWTIIPELFITIIFASLFLGKDFSRFKKTWKITKSQIMFAQTMSWGQYVVGFLVALLIIVPFFDGNILSAALIEIGFEGGHGTAAGLRDTFGELGFSEGADLAVGLATFGILSGVITGIILINRGVRKNKTAIAKRPEELSLEKKQGIYIEDEPDSIQLTTRSHSIDTISLHIAVILVTIGLGMILLRGLVLLEEVTWGAAYDVHIISYIPLFPIAMLSGVMIQMIIQKTGLNHLINRKLMLSIQNFTLDFLIVAAITNLSLEVIGDNTATFLTLAIAGYSWNLFGFIYLAPKMIKPYWFERGMTDYGQSMGMTTTGLLLLQMVDPKNETPAFESYGYIQLFFEPFVGGGLFTAASMPLIAEFGPYPMLGITATIMIIFLIIGLITNKKVDLNNTQYG